MAAREINVNKADINSAPPDDLPIGLMGLFFFAYRDFVGDADALLARQGFGRAHHRVLYFVNIRPGLAVAELLDILKITKQSLARVLRQLIDNGYIEQQTGQADRRQRLLFPTQTGRAFFETLSRPQAARIEAALERLPPEARLTVESFFIGMVGPADRGLLGELRLTDKA